MKTKTKDIQKYQSEYYQLHKAEFAWNQKRRQKEKLKKAREFLTHSKVKGNSITDLTFYFYIIATTLVALSVGILIGKLI